MKERPLFFVLNEMDDSIWSISLGEYANVGFDREWGWRIISWKVPRLFEDHEAAGWSTEEYLIKDENCGTSKSWPLAGQNLIAEGLFVTARKCEPRMQQAGLFKVKSPSVKQRNLRFRVNTLQVKNLLIFTGFASSNYPGFITVGSKFANCRMQVSL